MRRALIVTVIAVLLLVRIPVRAEDLVYDKFSDYLESLRSQAGIPGLEAIIVGKSDILWEHPYGYQDLDRSIATRTDTPMHFDGVTETLTASLLLRCVEDGHFSLDDRIGAIKSGTPDPNLTLRQVLTHTTGAPDSLVFSYKPERIDGLTSVVRACTDDSFRETFANLLDQFAMRASVPGPDVVRLVPPAEGILTPASERYKSVLDRLAVPYSVDSQHRASVSKYSATTLTPTTGLVSTVRDMAQFDLGLKSGVMLHADTLASAWRAPLGADGQRLPHGIGWFVQNYSGENVVWQFGVGDASSSLLVTLPGRNLTLILAANSNGLVKPFALSAGDLTASPFGKLFLGTFVR